MLQKCNHSVLAKLELCHFYWVICSSAWSRTRAIKDVHIWILTSMAIVPTINLMFSWLWCSWKILQYSSIPCITQQRLPLPTVQFGLKEQFLCSCGMFILLFLSFMVNWSKIIARWVYLVIMNKTWYTVRFIIFSDLVIHVVLGLWNQITAVLNVFQV